MRVNWGLFMTWNELTFTQNTLDHILEVYKSPVVKKLEIDHTWIIFLFIYYKSIYNHWGLSSDHSEAFSNFLDQEVPSVATRTSSVVLLESSTKRIHRLALPLKEVKAKVTAWTGVIWRDLCTIVEIVTWRDELTRAIEVNIARVTILASQWRIVENGTERIHLGAMPFEKIISFGTTLTTLIYPS